MTMIKTESERLDRESRKKILKDLNSNFFVDAGAGSGKTAVLTERVITKLKKGINVNELLVLTFTNEASNEMKQRIRNAIEKEENLKKELLINANNQLSIYVRRME